MPHPLGEDASMENETVSDVFEIDAPHQAGSDKARTMPKAEELLPQKTLKGVHRDMHRILKDALPRLNI